MTKEERKARRARRRALHGLPPKSHSKSKSKRVVHGNSTLFSIYGLLFDCFKQQKKTHFQTNAACLINKRM
ncbi:hypothetical protein L218DRAFT_968282 [Marasmius fiardii PR-910]|nr:hypothetical protein L218DRAFT_968282 [Marasmius fiardii PR-910]